ncbi:hypothetical protein D3C73_1321360 [compost metagenome]
MFVELTHGQAQATGLDGCSIQQCGISQNHSTRMHGDVPGKAIQPFGKVNQQVQLLVLLQGSPFHPPGKITQLGLLNQGLTEFACRESPQLLGDLTDFIVRHPQGHAGITNCTTCPVAVLHAHQGDPFGPKAVKDLSVDVVPFSTFHININVWKGGPPAG